MPAYDFTLALTRVIEPRPRYEVELERQDPRRVARGKGSLQRKTAMNTRKELAMATTPESFVDALNSAFGKVVAYVESKLLADALAKRLGHD